LLKEREDLDERSMIFFLVCIICLTIFCILIGP
jgi:hypothetical protein